MNTFPRRVDFCQLLLVCPVVTSLPLVRDSHAFSTKHWISGIGQACVFLGCSMSALVLLIAPVNGYSYLRVLLLIYQYLITLFPYFS